MKNLVCDDIVCCSLGALVKKERPKEFKLQLNV